MPAPRLGSSDILARATTCNHRGVFAFVTSRTWPGWSASFVGSRARKPGRNRLLPRDRSRRRPRVDQLLRDRLHAEVQAFQGARTQQHKISRLPEHDLIRRALACDGDQYASSPPLEDGAVRLAEQPSVVVLDAQ